MGQDYIHGASPVEQERLEIQHKLIGGASFLPEITPEMRVLDVGCGTGVVAREIAPLLAKGSVVGIDLQPEQIALAKGLAAQSGLTNVIFQIGTATDLPFEDRVFDMVYSRFLLEHLSGPLLTLREMVRVAKIGGLVVACECSVDCCMNSVPPMPTAKRAMDAVYKLQSLKGGNPYIGQDLLGLFQKAGLGDIRTDTLQSELTDPDEIRSYAMGGERIIRACETELLERALIDRDSLLRAYREWLSFSETPGARSSFRLLRSIGNRRQ